MSSVTRVPATRITPLVSVRNGIGWLCSMTKLMGQTYLCQVKLARWFCGLVLWPGSVAHLCHHLATSVLDSHGGGPERKPFRCGMSRGRGLG